MSPERLRSLRYLVALVGVALMLVGAYAAGGVETGCNRTDGRVDCRMETMRWFGLVTTDQATASDVVGTYVRTSTSSQTSRTPAGSTTTRTTSDNTVVLTTRGGGEVDAYGATSHDAFEHTGLIEKFLRDKSRGRLFLSSSDWPFGLVACGFGLVWTVGTVLVVRAINSDS